MDLDVGPYVLQSTRYHGALIKDAQSRNPKVFARRIQAWCFKAKRGKWHWRVVPKQQLAANPIAELPKPAARKVAA